MDRDLLIYAAFIAFFAILMGLILATPILSFSQDMSAYYKAFAWTCHQKISRSLCVFTDGKSYWIGDCTPQNGVFISDEADRTQVEVVETSPAGATITGYKMPVCSRDVGIYGAMLFGALVYPLMRDIRSKSVWPAAWLILAMVPLGIDGTVQLVSEFGFLPFVYESTNAIRLATGALAGFAAAIYAIPILMNMFGEPDGEQAAPPAKKTGLPARP